MTGCLIGRNVEKSMRANPYCYILTCTYHMRSRGDWGHLCYGTPSTGPFQQGPFNSALATGDTNLFVFSFASANH